MSVIVIGHSSGIGKAIYDKLDYLGLEPIGMSRTRYVGKRSSYVYCDVMNPDSIIDALKEVFWKDITGMIYCAGSIAVGPIRESSYVETEQVLSTNLLGAMYATKLFTLLSPGFIIYIASTAGSRAEPLFASYAASKAGLINYAMSVSEAFPERRIYCVSPGRCATPLRKLIAPNEDQSKIMQPEKVAELVAHLVFDTDGNLSAQNIEVRGRL